MRLFLVTVLFFSFVVSSFGQSLPDGLWNAGGIIVPNIKGQTGKAVPEIKHALIRIDLYPGVSIVKSSYTLSNPGTFDASCTIELKDSGRFHQSSTGTVFIRTPALIKTLLNDSILSSNNTGFQTWHITIPAGDSVQLTVYQLTENYQSKLVKEGNSREANAMVVKNEHPEQFLSAPCEVQIRLQEPLTLTGILGISPAKKTTGDLRHFHSILKEDPLLIWYEGLPGDFNFTKKILPQADALFAAIDQFPESEFNQADFSVVDKNNFSTNPMNPLAAILYFIMFFAPWIILAGFVIFLLKKPRKKLSNPD